MSKDILSQDEIDALLQGLGQEDEEGEAVPDKVIEMTASRVEGEGFPAELDSWEGGTIPADEAAEMPVQLWGQIEITGSAEGRALYYVDPDSYEVWRGLAGEDEEISAAELIEYFADAFSSTVASMSAEESGQLVDIRPLPPDEGDVSEVIGELDQWFRLDLHFSAGEEIECAIGLLLPADSLPLFPDGEHGMQEAEEEELMEEAATQEEEAPQEEPARAPSGQTVRKKRVEKAELPDFQQGGRPARGSRDRRMDMLLDVPLNVSVELGRTRSQVRDVLSLGSGSVLELDRQAGEPVDVLVNGKLMARGEVVVVDENFAVRITEIISREKRLKNLQ